MEKDLKANPYIELDFLGQYYTSIINKEIPGSFMITTYLKEDVDKDLLQNAVDDIVKRLPFLSGRIISGFFSNRLEIIAPPKIESSSDYPVFSEYYKQGEGHVLRVLYGQKHFTVETIHSIGDGRSLKKITEALIARYFELKGLKFDYGDIINCHDQLIPEEYENAYEKFVDNFQISNEETNSKKNSSKEETNSKKKSKTKNYHPIFSKTSDVKVITQKYEVNKLRELAKEHNATITEYILAHMFTIVKEERDASLNKGNIVIMVPIDCRTYMPTMSLRNFISVIPIDMPEESDFNGKVKQISKQFSQIDEDFLYRDVGEHEKLFRYSKYLPRIIKKRIMILMKKAEEKKYTTGFTNLGVVKLPEEIENEIEMMEFIVGIEDGTPYFFSCISVGNTLTLTVTTREDCLETSQNVVKNLVK